MIFSTNLYFDLTSEYQVLGVFPRSNCFHHFFTSISTKINDFQAENRTNHPGDEHGTIWFQKLPGVEKLYILTWEEERGNGRTMTLDIAGCDIQWPWSITHSFNWIGISNVSSAPHLPNCHVCVWVCACVCGCVYSCVCEGYESFYWKIVDISTKCQNFVTFGGILFGRSIDFKWNILYVTYFFLPCINIHSTSLCYLWAAPGRDVYLLVFMGVCVCVCVCDCPLKVFHAIIVDDSRVRGSDWHGEEIYRRMCHYGVCSTFCLFLEFIWVTCLLGFHNTDSIS